MPQTTHLMFDGRDVVVSSNGEYLRISVEAQGRTVCEC